MFIADNELSTCTHLHREPPVTNTSILSLQLTKLLENMNETLVKKGKEINEYREKHGIRVRGQEPPPSDAEKPSSSAGVLVANKA